jgi:hypothetical protein
MSRRVTLALIASLLLIGLATAPAGAKLDRFSGYVGGSATGRGHNFVVGDGLNLVFTDRGHSFTHYRVCWQMSGGGSSQCWSRTTGRKGQRDVKLVAAPGEVGDFIVTWSVKGSIKDHWTFYNGVGD